MKQITIDRKFVNHDYLVSNEIDKYEKVIFSKNVQLVNDKAFFEFKKLQAIEFLSNGNPVYFKFGAFAHCDNLKKVIFPEQIVLQSNVFAHCTSLRSIYLPKNTLEMFNFIFEGCSDDLKIFYNGSKEEFKNIPGSFEYSKSYDVITIDAISVDTLVDRGFSLSAANSLIKNYNNNEDIDLSF